MVEALGTSPEDVDLLAYHAGLSLDGFSLGYAGSDATLDEAFKAMEAASARLPSHPRVQFVDGLLALVTGELSRAGRCGRETRRLSAGDPATAANGEWLITLVTDVDADGCIQVATDADADALPGWINHPRFLACCRKSDYEAALSAAIRFGMPDFFWGPLERAAALGQLGLRRAAHAEVSRVVQLNPRFARDPARFLTRYIPSSDVSQHVREGLEKAGLGTRVV